MLEQQGKTLRFYGYFTATKQGKTGLTVTIDVRRNGTLVVTGGSATEEGGGFYYYDLASGSNNADGYYTAVFKTADSSVDFQHVPALWVVGRDWVDNVDAAVSSRSSHAAADVWSAGTRTLTAAPLAYRSGRKGGGCLHV